MKKYIGIGTGHDALSMVNEASKGLTKPTFILTMAPYNQLAKISEILAQKYPDAQIIGTSGTTLCNGSISESNLILTAFFSDCLTACGIIPDVTSAPVKSIARIKKDFDSISPSANNTICLEFTTGGEEQLVTTFNSILCEKNISLLGGSVFGYPDDAIGQVAYNGKIYENACVYAFIKNTTGKVKVYKENLYEKTNHIKHYVTKSNNNSRILMELDHKPALEVYCNEMGIEKEKGMDYVFTNPLGRVVGDEVYISSFASINPDSTINMFKILNPNDVVYILDLVDYEVQIAKTHKKIQHDFSNISLIFSVDCIYRYLLFENKNFMKTYTSLFKKVGSHIGIIGGGEQYNNQHVNQTMVCVVFE